MLPPRNAPCFCGKIEDPMSVCFAILTLILSPGLDAFAGSFVAHSHNDFEQKRPLEDALDAQFQSVEVDVVDRWDQVRVTHLGVFTIGTLKEMYLDPLQKRVNEKGSVYGDKKPFYLWIELRAFFAGAKVVPLLRQLLAQYPMFAQFDRQGKMTKRGAVIAIIGGYSRHKENYFKGQSETPACMALNSGEWLESGHDPRALWIALKWTRYAGDWDGNGTPPLELKEKVKNLIARVHQQGKKVRFWKNPETAEFWQLMIEVRADQAGTDSLKETHDALEAIHFLKKPM